MTTMQMYDAAYPPAHPPAWPVVAGYLGGDTPHVWSRAEWEHQPARYRLPIWVRSNPGSVDAASDAARAVKAAAALGVPHGATVALDFETAVNAAYVHAFDAAMSHAGYKTLLYGSASSVHHNPVPSGGYWVAEWTGAPHMAGGAATVATQWTNGSGYDSSIIDASVPLWDAHTGKSTDQPAAPRKLTAAQQQTHDVWCTDGVIPVPDAWDPGNDTWQAASILVYAVGILRDLRTRIERIEQKG